MENAETAIALVADLRRRLDRVSIRTGLSVNVMVNDALARYLDDHEDVLTARGALEEFRQSGDDAINADTIEWPEK